MNEPSNQRYPSCDPKMSFYFDLKLLVCCMLEIVLFLMLHLFDNFHSPLEMSDDKMEHSKN